MKYYKDKTIKYQNQITTGKITAIMIILSDIFFNCMRLFGASLDLSLFNSNITTDGILEYFYVNEVVRIIICILISIIIGLLVIFVLFKQTESIVLKGLIVYMVYVGVNCVGAIIFGSTSIIINIIYIYYLFSWRSGIIKLEQENIKDIIA